MDQRELDVTEARDEHCVVAMGEAGLDRGGPSGGQEWTQGWTTK